MADGNHEAESGWNAARTIIVSGIDANALKSLLCALLLTGCASAPPAKAVPEAWALPGVSAQDAEYLINEALRLVIERKCLLGDLNFLADPKRIPVLTPNAGFVALKPVGDVVFEPVSERTLQERAEADGAYVYHFRFNKIAREGSVIVVELANVPKYAANPKTRAFGSGVAIEFSRQNGKWTHTCARAWIA